LRVFEKTLSLLDDLAARALLLLVLEDLHWADPFGQTLGPAA
jgi:predicted ATPase